jgi:hypothetical protein
MAEDSFHLARIDSKRVPYENVPETGNIHIQHTFDKTYKMSRVTVFYSKAIFSGCIAHFLHNLFCIFTRFVQPINEIIICRIANYFSELRTQFNESIDLKPRLQVVQLSNFCIFLLKVNRGIPDSNVVYLTVLKGTVPRDFQPKVFSLNNPP